MSIHPEILKILNYKLNCPACDLELQCNDSYYSCKNKLCANITFYPSSNLNSTIDSIMFKSCIGRDETVEILQNFQTETITLLISPHLKFIVIPSFPIDFKNLEKLPHKLKLYLVLS